MSVLDNKLNQIGKKLEATKMPRGDFPYKFGTSIFTKLVYTFFYVCIGGYIASFTFGTNKILIFADALGENKEYSVYLQVLVLLVLTAIYFTQVLASIKISRTEIEFPIFYNFSKKKVEIKDIEQIGFDEIITVPRGLGLLADIFPRLFSSIEASLYVNNKIHTFKVTSKELQIVKVLQELQPEKVNAFFYNLEDDVE